VLIAKLISLTTIVIGFILLGPVFGIIGLAAIVVSASVLQASFLGITNKMLEGKENVK
jgi:apolipoprotein N-acyltransferase